MHQADLPLHPASHTPDAITAQWHNILQCFAVLADLCTVHACKVVARTKLPCTDAGAAPDTTDSQPAATKPNQASRHALQSRADQLQGGNLTPLLMSWFDAGYQMGKLEAQSNAASY